MTPDIPTLQAEIAYYRAALRGLRGLAVLEATESVAWRKAVIQIDEVLEGPLPSEDDWRDREVMRRDMEADIYRREQESENRHNDQHRNAVPKDWSR